MNEFSDDDDSIIRLSDNFIKEQKKKQYKRLIIASVVIVVITVLTVYYLQGDIMNIDIKLNGLDNETITDSVSGMTYFIDPKNCYVWSKLVNGVEDQYIINSPPPDLSVYIGSIDGCTSVQVSENEFTVNLDKDAKFSEMFDAKELWDGQI